MIVSGRCHGPGCQQAALVSGGFCSERCQARWTGQFAAPQPMSAEALSELLGAVRTSTAMANLAAAVPAFQVVGMTSVVALAAEVERMTLAVQAVCPPEYLDTAMAEVDQRAAGMSRGEALRSVAADLAAGRLPEGRGAKFPLVASPSSQIAHDRMRGWLGRWLHRKRRG